MLCFDLGLATKIQQKRGRKKDLMLNGVAVVAVGVGVGWGL